MGAYILRRLLLMIPTLFGILAINFAVIQFAPGGPVEQVIAELSGQGQSSTSRFTGGGGDMAGGPAAMPGAMGGAEAALTSKYRGAQGLDPEFIKDLERQFGFDKPALERFWLMIKNYMTFNLGESYFRSISVTELVLEKMPVSISLGLWTTLIVYLVSIPLGVRKAVKAGGRFDVWTSGVIIAAYAIPSFLFAVLLRVLFAGGSYWNVFPLRGIESEQYANQPFFWEKALDLAWWGDYFWHLTLPVTAMVIGGFATLTLLTKNSFLEEISRQYVLTARAKGLSERKVLYGHVFRNAMLIVVAGFPAAFVGIFFTGSLLIETIFSLDGLGYLGYDAAIKRDYPVLFGTLFVFSLIGLVIGLLSDLVYTWIDPRIDFSKRGG
ncbi:microcin C ABC transporter permease YejB [Neomegalonema perideroedes]|uniref:microcin C ABC transporter permease YejB n=1 Tax=Neomegalonema perideroedes TaxID=217219 RepID=UPI0003728836|nr:microcin C ABC transporter permease YejB [Neomegalonema perideroedes]